MKKLILFSCLALSSAMIAESSYADLRCFDKDDAKLLLVSLPSEALANPSTEMDDASRIRNLQNRKRKTVSAFIDGNQVTAVCEGNQKLVRCSYYQPTHTPERSGEAEIKIDLGNNTGYLSIEEAPQNSIGLTCTPSS